MSAKAGGHAKPKSKPGKSQAAKVEPAQQVTEAAVVAEKPAKKRKREEAEDSAAVEADSVAAERPVKKAKRRAVQEEAAAEPETVDQEMTEAPQQEKKSKDKKKAKKAKAAKADDVEMEDAVQEEAGETVAKAAKLSKKAKRGKAKSKAETAEGEASATEAKPKAPVSTKAKSVKSTKAKNRPIKGTPSPIVFAGGMPFTLTSEGLTALVSEVAPPVNVRLDVKKDGRSKGCAWIQMKSIEAAEELVHFMNGRRIEGRIVKAEYANAPKPKPTAAPAAPSGSSTAPRAPNPAAEAKRKKAAACTAYVGNLSWTTDTEVLKEALGGFGDIKEVRLVYHQDTGRPKGFGYVEFMNAAAKQRAVLQGTMKLDGREIRIDYVTGEKSASKKPAADE